MIFIFIILLVIIINYLSIIFDYLDSRSLWAEVSSMYQGSVASLVGANGNGMTTT